MTHDTLVLICIELVVILAVIIGTIWLAHRRPGLTLILSLILSIALSITDTILGEKYGDYTSTNELFVIPLVFAGAWFPLVTFLLAFVPRPEIQDDWPWWKIVSRFVAWVISAILIQGLLIVLFNAMGVVFFVILVSAVIRYQMTARYNTALEFVSTLAASMRQNLPLPTALETAAVGRRDKTAHIFRRTAYWLTQGFSLGQAVRKGYPRCLPEVVSTIESAEQLSRLPETLVSLENDLVNHADETKKVRPVHPWYPVIVFIFVFQIVVGLCIFIIPTFATVMSDLSEGKANFPTATKILLEISNSFFKMPVLIAVISTTPVLIGWFAYLHFRTRVSFKAGPFINLVDRLRWYWPLQRKLERNIATLRLVEILRHGLSAGWPLNQTIGAALGVRMNICFQKRIRRWLNEVEQGINASQSARNQGIGTAVAWALDDKLNPGQAPVLLEMIEETCRNKHNYIGNLIRSILWPTVVLLMGLVIGFIMYAFFICLVSIINTGTDYLVP